MALTGSRIFPFAGEKPAAYIRIDRKQWGHLRFSAFTDARSASTAGVAADPSSVDLGEMTQAEEDRLLAVYYPIVLRLLNAKRAASKPPLPPLVDTNPL